MGVSQLMESFVCYIGIIQENMAYKNFWSLNTDEAIVSGILRSQTDKNLEVLMPMNAQMKGVDLVLMNVITKKSITIQVKGSKAFEPSIPLLKKCGQGSNGWFYLNKNVVDGATADYFIFLIYVIEENLEIGRRTLSPHSIIIPTSKLQELTQKYKKLYKDGYSYYLWINPKTKEAFDFRDEKYFVSEFLDKSGYSKLNELLL